MNVRVERWLEEHLYRQVWSFHVGGFDWDDGSPRIVCDWWRREFRPTRRHRLWIAEAHWERLSSRNKVGPPEIPDDVVAEVQAAVAARFVGLPVVLS